MTTSCTSTQPSTSARHAQLPAKHANKLHRPCVCLAILAAPLSLNHAHASHTTFKQEPHVLYVTTAVKHATVWSIPTAFLAVPRTTEQLSAVVNVFVKQVIMITALMLNAFNVAINAVLVPIQQLAPLAIVLSFDQTQRPCVLVWQGTLRTQHFNAKSVHTTVFNAQMQLPVRFVIPQIELLTR